MPFILSYGIVCLIVGLISSDPYPSSVHHPVLALDFSSLGVKVCRSLGYQELVSKCIALALEEKKTSVSEWKCISGGKVYSE